MEEMNKNNVQAEPDASGKKPTKLYTEAEVNQACQRLYQRLLAQMQRMDMTNTFKRLDYLFQILDHKDMFEPEFIAECVSELTSAMKAEDEPEAPKEGETEASEAGEADNGETPKSAGEE